MTAISRALCALFVLLLLCSLGSAFAAEAPSAASPARIVRVGVYENEGFFTIRPDGTRSGRLAQLYDELLPYTNWQYEWVVGNWQQCMSWVQSGVVDLVGTVIKQPQRESAMDFSALSCGTSHTHLIALRSNHDLTAAALNAHGLLRVGTLFSSALADNWSTYAQAHNINTTLTRYANEREMNDALFNGEIDALLNNRPPVISGMRDVLDFSPQPFYFAVGKGNDALLGELNAALKALAQVKPSYGIDMDCKPMPIARIARSWQSSELNFIETSAPICVALVDNLPSVSQYDPKTDTFSGIAFDFLELISRKTGLRFTYLPYAVDSAPDEAAQIIAPVVQSIALSLPAQYALSNAIMDSRMLCLTRIGYLPSEKENFIIALCRDMRFMEPFFQSRFPNAVLLYYPSTKQALTAVSNANADLCFANELVSSSLLQSPYLNDLIICHTYQYDELICFALTKNNDMLLSVLNRALGEITEEERTAILIKNTVGATHPYTLGEQLYANRTLLFFILGAAILFVALIYFYLTNCAREHQRIHVALMEKEASENANRELEEINLNEHRNNRVLLKQANFSEKAGIFNRRGFIEATRKLLDTYPDVQFTMMMLELVRFRAFCELFGYQEGDRLIASIGITLRDSYLRSSAVYGHLEDCSFAICLPSNSLSADELLKKLDTCFRNAPQEYDLVMRLGCAVADDPTISVSMLMENAFLALREAKAAQFTRCAVYDEALSARMKLTHSILTDLPAALRERQFQVYYQPQYSLRTNQLTGMEALARWIHPEYGIISPGIFIPLLEQNGLITRLSEYIRDEVIRQICEWKVELGREVSVSINVSRVDTFATGFTEQLTRQMDLHGLDHRLLRLEITETAYIQNEAHICRVVTELRKAGFRVEMDDFGSGYSSLNTLKDLPVDLLKLDMKFMMNTQNERGNIILIAVVEMAKRMGLPMIAEGVETREQVDFLRSIGCECMQGYYCHRPMPAHDMTALLRADALAQ
ncbi:MAG: EAL domain-containing protein [Clostridia bacterium]